jgi:hypothetical protein
VVLAVAALAILVAAAFYGPKAHAGHLTAVVTVRGEEIARVALDTLTEPRTIEIDEPFHLTVTLTREGAAITRSDCPNQDCVHTGTITRAGQSIVCLPGQVVVQLEGAASDGPDVIVG